MDNLLTALLYMKLIFYFSPQADFTKEVSHSSFVVISLIGANEFALSGALSTSSLHFMFFD